MVKYLITNKINLIEIKIIRQDWSYLSDLCIYGLSGMFGRRFYISNSPPADGKYIPLCSYITIEYIALVYQVFALLNGINWIG